LYPFETHGHYWNGIYHFGNTPLINYLPDFVRNQLAPHVRAYTAEALRSLFLGLPVRVVKHTQIYPGYDNVAYRHPAVGSVLRRVTYGTETFILCRSEARKEKDRAIVGRATDRLTACLDRLRKRLTTAKQPVDRDRVNQQIGRMLARHSRAAKKFLIEVKASTQHASRLELVVQGNLAWQQWSERSAGCYLLRSNVTGWSEEELWRTYIQLTEAEAAFHIQKSDLSIRPVWHQREDRVRAHIFVNRVCKD
jgi:hypothetical protein